MEMDGSTLPSYRHSLAGALLAAREAVMAPIRPHLLSANVTEQQWRVLRVLGQRGAIDATTVAREALLNPTSLSRILRQLAARGLIERVVDMQDGRRSIVSITQLGASLVDGTASGTAALLQRYAELFGVERLAALRRELQALTEVLRDAE